MQKVINIWHKTAPKLIHPVDSYKAWHFQKTDLGYLFADKHRILVHAEPGLNMPSIQHLLRSMEIYNVSHAKKLASSLGKLSIREILVENGVDLTKNLIYRDKLMFALHEYIAQARSFNRMVIKEFIMVPHLVGAKRIVENENDLIIAQHIKFDVERDKMETRELIKQVVLRGITREDEHKIIQETFPPEALDMTIRPGGSDPAVAENARTLSWIPDRETGLPLLDPEALKVMDLKEKMKLEGVILDALVKFKEQYMAIANANGDMGPMEARRLQTFQIGYIFTKLVRPTEKRTYLTQDEFDIMPFYQKVQLGYGTPNFIFVAIKNFLIENGMMEKAGSITPYDVFEDPQIAKMIIVRFEEQQRS